MFVDPKITLTRRVTDPAGTIRKARVLLDQHLRQDAAYNRQVSKTLYFIGPDVTCQITHEFNQTYIALDQKTQPEPVALKKESRYRFLNILQGDYTIGYTYLTAWLSQNGSSWTQIPIPPGLATVLQYGIASFTQISSSQLFVIGQFTPGQPVGWAFANSQNLSYSSPQLLPLLEGEQVILSNGAAFVGGSVVCFSVRTASGNYVVWFDYAQNQYLYTIPYPSLNLPNTSSFPLAAAPIALTRTGPYAPVAFGVALTGETGLWSADVNASTFQFLGGLSTSYTGSYLPILMAGANGQLGVSVPSAASSQPAVQTGTNFSFLTPSGSASYSTVSFSQTSVGFGYSPIGWTSSFEAAPTDLYFFQPTGSVSMVPRSNGSQAFIKYVVAPDGIYDVMGGGLYLSPTQKSALPLGLPPYSDPNNPAYALNTPGLISSAFYLGTPIMPWLNLY